MLHTLTDATMSDHLSEELSELMDGANEAEPSTKVDPTISQDSHQPLPVVAADTVGRRAASGNPGLISDETLPILDTNEDLPLPSSTPPSSTPRPPHTPSASWNAQISSAPSSSGNPTPWPMPTMPKTPRDAQMVKDDINKSSPSKEELKEKLKILNEAM